MKNYKTNLILSLFLSLIIFGSLFLFSGFILALTYQTRFFPRTKISNIDLSGMTKKEALDTLSQKNDEFLKQILTLNYSGQEKKLSLNEVSVAINANQSIEETFKETHSGFFNSIFKALDSILFAAASKQNSTLDLNKLSTVITDLAKNNSTPATDASLKIDNNSIIFKEAVEGEGPDFNQTQEGLTDQISNLKNTALIINKIKIYPEISDLDLAQAYFRASNLLQNKGFAIKNNSQTLYRVNSRDLKNWLKFDKKTYLSFNDSGQFQGRVAGVSISTKDEAGVFILPQLIESKQALNASIDITKVNDFVKLLAAKVDEDALDAKLGIVNNAVTVLTKEKYGQTLDQKKLFEEIDLRLNSSSQSDIDLPIATVTPAIRSDNISELGLKEKIATGISSFSGSPKNRINNLTIGTSKFNGAIIAPDQVASFAEIVGSVDESQGYLPELVIKGTETIQELGGGMCQVSTTFYRAALNTGVPIIERHSHAYLVGYYKDGPDATVYVPSTDLKWKNDTGHYILVQTRVDPTTKKVTFDFWGTSDGRKVTVSAPVYTDIVPAPVDPYFVDDPTFPTGYLVEEEHPHEGALGTILRTITYPDGKIKTDTIKSTYKPWPAKMRRGTGPADLPIPTPNP